MEISLLGIIRIRLITTNRLCWQPVVVSLQKVLFIPADHTKQRQTSIIFFNPKLCNLLSGRFSASYRVIARDVENDMSGRRQQLSYQGECLGPKPQKGASQHSYHFQNKGRAFKELVVCRMLHQSNTFLCIPYF